MADVNANIGVGIDTSDALSQLKALQRQISLFHSSIAKSSETAAVAQRNLQKNFVNSINSIGAFSAELRSVRTTAENFTTSLERNKFSMGEYFRYAGGASKTFGKIFTNEFNTIEKVATERVKTIQTQYIKLGRDANGAMQSIAVRPLALDMQNLGTQTQIAAQKQAIMNQLIRQGSTNLLNFGKNTQWAGRQLMVGFTLPLASLGLAAGKTFMQMEEQAIKFKKVYGDLFTTAEEKDKALADIKELADGFTQYGIAVADSIGVAAEAAAAGFSGVDLQNQTSAALRLSVLGQVEYQKALETTISLQNSFKVSSQQLASDIDFLNAVENQTVVSLDDVTTAIPKAAPVVQSLGGDVKDLAFFLAAMKEGGINASEGANALKSGLASLINPTEKAAQFLAGMGVNLRGIVDANKGDVSGIVVDFAKALDTLDPTNRAQAIEQLFGKFQFARLSTLFDNVTSDTSQAARVLELAGASVEELAALSESELGVTAESAMMRFRAAVEDLRAALAPIGKVFLEAVTPILNSIVKIAEGFNNLPDGVKQTIVVLTGVIGALGPVALMTFGLLANGIANAIKFVAILREGYLRLTGQSNVLGASTEYMTQEQLEAAAAAASLDQAHAQLTQQFTVEKGAVDALRVAYEQAIVAGNKFALLNPGSMKPSVAGPTKKFANGGFVSGSGNGDIIPAMLTPGEFVIKKDVAQKMLPILELINAGKIPGFSEAGQVGRSGSRRSSGTGLMNIVPGGSELAHFSEPVEMLGRELIAMTEAAVAAGKATQKHLEKVMNTVGDNLDGMFRVFDSRVEALSSELNQAVGKVGSGKTVSKDIVQRDLVERGADARLPLIDKLVRNNVPLDDAMQKAQMVTDEIDRKLAELGDDVLFTAERINEITQEAYEAVAKIDDEVDQAYQQMRELSSVGVDRPGSTRGQREDIAKTGYKAQRSRTKTLANKVEGAGAYGIGGFKTTPEMADIAGVSELEIQEMFKQLTPELKTRVAAQLKNGTAAYVAALMEAAEQGVVTGIEESTQQKSPSVVARKAGENIGNGAIDGIESTIPEARKAGEIAGSAVAEGAVASAGRTPRRAQSGGNLSFDQQSRQYVNQEKAAQLLAGRQAGLARLTNLNIERFKALSTKITGASFAITSLAGVASMFGGKIGEAANAIFSLSMAFSALSGVTSLLVTAKRAELAAQAGGMLTNLMAGRTIAGDMVGGGFRGGAKGKAGLANAGKNVGAVASTMFPKIAQGVAKFGVILGKVGLTFTKFIPIVGLIITALTLAIDGFNRSRDAVNGLGETANLSSEKLKGLGERFDVEIRDPNFAGQFVSGKAGSEKAGVAAKTKELVADEQFANDFKLQIEAIKNASKEDAQRTLNSLAIQLSSSGFEEEAVQSIINALAEKAGKKTLDLKFAGVKFSSEEGLASISRVAQETSAKLNNSFKAFDLSDALFGGAGGGQLKAQIQSTAGDFASLFSALKLGFESGEISAEDFNVQMAEISSQLDSINPAALKDLVPEIAKKIGPEFEEAIKGVENYNDKLLLIKATTAGVEIPQKVVKGLQAASKAGANTKQLKDAVKIRKELNRLILQTATATEKANEAAAQQEVLDADVQQGIEAMEAKTGSLEDQANAYDILIQQGYDQATAQEVAADGMFAAAIAAAAAKDAINGTNVELATTLSYLNAMLDAQDKAQVSAAPTGGGGGGGGGGGKSAQQEAIDDLKNQRKEIIETNKAYASLRAGGFSAGAAFEYAKDPVLAAALASTQVGTAKWRELVGLIKQAAIESVRYLDGQQQAFEDLQGVAEEYFSILDNQVEEKYEDSIRAQEAAIDDLSDAIDTVNQQLEDYQERVSDLQRESEIAFDRPIEALNEEASDITRELELMDRQVEDINKSYDDQRKALEKVNKLNQQIVSQQKQQISLADALSSGDISAAAQLMQDMRASNADAAATTVGDMLDANQQAEIDALQGESGRNREQLLERQRQITDAIYQLEEQREAALAAIRVLEDEIYLITENTLEPLQNQLTAQENILESIEDQKQAELDAIEAQRDKWQEANLALGLAQIQAGKYNSVIEMTSKLVGDVTADWRSLADKTIQLTIEQVLKSVGGPEGAATGESGAAETGGSGGGGGVDDGPRTRPEVTIPTKDEKGTPKSKKKDEDPFAFITDLQEAVDDFFNQPWVTSIVAIFQGTGQVIDEMFFQPIRDTIGDIFTTIGTELANFGNTLATNISTEWTKVTTGIYTTFIQPVEQFFTDLGAAYDEKIGKPINEFWNTISTEIDTNFVQPVKSFFSDIGTSFDTMFIQPIKEMWTGFTEWFSSDMSLEDKIDDVKEWWAALPDKIKNVFEVRIPAFFGTLVESAKTRLGGISTWFNNLPTTISTAFSTLGTTIGEGLKPGINAIIRALNNLGNITLPKSVFGLPLPPAISGKNFRLWNLQQLNKGGMVRGIGTKDTVPAMLTPGEYVINRNAVSRFGMKNLEDINNGIASGKDKAQRVGPQRMTVKPMAFSNLADRAIAPRFDLQYRQEFISNTPIENTNNKVLDNSSVYNYNVSVNVNGTNSDANQIANAVMTRIKQLEMQKIQRQVVR